MTVQTVPHADVHLFRDFAAAIKLLLEVDGSADGNLIAKDCATATIDLLMSTSGNSARMRPELLSSEEVCHILDVYDLARDLALQISSAMHAYPGVKQRIDDALLVCAYAQATIVPAAMLGNKDVLRRKQEGGLVKTYIVKSGTGLIKIGRSCDVDGRVKSLQTGAGGRINVLFVIDGDVEQELHRKFADIRVFGEWFSDDGRIAAYIEEMKQGGCAGGMRRAHDI